jgi:putative transposase
MSVNNARARAQDANEISDAVWYTARERASALRRLSKLHQMSAAVAQEESEKLGISSRHLYTLLKRYRDGQELVSDSIPRVSSGGRGRSRLNPAVDGVIQDLIRTRFLTPNQISGASLHRKIADTCKECDLPVPSVSAIRRRLAQLDPIVVTRRRLGVDAARRLQSAGGSAPDAAGPLARVEIDHSPVDAIVVDELERKDIGRPYLTIAIDNYSRCIVGMVILLNAPSTLTVGLCLTHIATNKGAYLDAIGVDAAWPMCGIPKSLYLDNAAEFWSHALQRGCEQHGIELDHRPPMDPKFGGTVERVIGTFQEIVHELPGTTQSNPAARGRYDSEGRAVLTLREFERWMSLAVIHYNGTFHSTLMETPAARWGRGVERFGPPKVVTDASAFLRSFLPIVRRTLTREGFVIDYVRYYSNALKPWIAKRSDLPPFVIRRDPRDIGRVWVEDPAGSELLEVPSRSLSQEPVSLWEHHAAIRRSHELGRSTVNELELTRLRREMNRQVDEATASTRKTRRAVQNRRSLPRGAPEPSLPVPHDEREFTKVKSFEELEDW